MGEILNFKSDSVSLKFSQIFNRTGAESCTSILTQKFNTDDQLWALQVEAMISPNS